MRYRGYGIRFIVLTAGIVAVFAAKTLLVRNEDIKTETYGVREAASSVEYSCAGGGGIKADFYKGESKPPAGPEMPPSPGGSVDLKLSDGRAMTLPQTISADGARYANEDESIIFWSRGDGAFIIENGVETYSDCAVSP